jgi:subtilisin family serine protease
MTTRKEIKMARYVMSNRRSGKFHESEKRASRASLDTSFHSLLAPNVQLIGDTNPVDDQKRRVVIFEAEPPEVEAKQASLPSDVILEPEILHYTEQVSRRFYSAFSPFVAIAEALPVAAGSKLAVTVEGSGNPLVGVEVTLLLRGPGGLARIQTAHTSPLGETIFNFSPVWTPTALIADPAGGFWSVVVRGPEDGMTVNVPPLPLDGPLAWWHRVLGISNPDPTRGSQIKVGVIDSGVGPHGFLAHVTSVGSFIDGTFDPGGGGDSDSHGSHVCGTIGARPVNGPDFMGIAPGVDLFCARVFPPGRGANQGDIADAIDSLSKDHQVDLINLSLGAPSPSQIERDAIRDALERGTLCVCAAANSAGPVEFPAAFPESVAVSALGLEGWGPDGTVASTRQPLEREKFGSSRMFLANFSCFGPEIDCCAPGVGIISTLPERHGLPTPYGSKDGTSMASPAACGALAAILSATPDYRALPRDVGRAERARALLKASCEDVGMEVRFQGRGMPRII